MGLGCLGEGDRWGLGIFFTCSYLLCYFFGAPKIAMDEEISKCWCLTAVLLVAAGSTAQVKQMLSSIL